VTAPDFLYGTAWQEDRTPALTDRALRAGFRGIDTANQRRHSFEAGVGQGLAAGYRAGVEHLATEHVDSYVSHGPASGYGGRGGDLRFVGQARDHEVRYAVIIHSAPATAVGA
jgi:hypothetical protein